MNITIHIFDLFLIVLVILMIGAVAGASLVHFVAKWQLNRMRKNLHVDIEPHLAELRRERDKYKWGQW